MHLVLTYIIDVQNGHKFQIRFKALRAATIDAILTAN